MVSIELILTLLPHASHASANTLWLGSFALCRALGYLTGEAMSKLKRHSVLAVVCVSFFVVSLYAENAADPVVSSSRSSSVSVKDSFGMGVKVGLLGVGAEIAGRVERHV